MCTAKCKVCIVKMAVLGNSIQGKIVGYCKLQLLSVLCLCVWHTMSDVCNHDFCKKALSGFDVTWHAHLYYGLVVQNAKFSS